jgi:DNA-binding beta-propeller fold protein YncE
MKHRIERTLVTTFALMVLSAAASQATWADERVIVKSNAAKKFATMPDGAPQPEGITRNPANGDIIVGTFFGAVNLVRFSKSGKVRAAVTIDGGPLLGLAYNAVDGKVYICSADDLAGGPSASRIRRIDAQFVDTWGVEEVAEVPFIGAPGARIVGNPDGSEDVISFGNFGRAPNDLTFDGDGNLYYSDSFQGAVFHIANPADNCPFAACITDTVAHDPLLATAGFPPFGANGVALNPEETLLYVANTGDDRVLTVNVDTGEVLPFAESINGADGIVTDAEGRVWVAANQADQVVVLNGTTGATMAELGEFLGISKNGTPRGLLFPASLVIVDDKKVLVTNLAAALGSSAGEPEAIATKYTVSRINMPKFDDD